MSAAGARTSGAAPRPWGSMANFPPPFALRLPSAFFTVVADFGIFGSYQNTAEGGPNVKDGSPSADAKASDHESPDGQKM